MLEGLLSSIGTPNALGGLVQNKEIAQIAQLANKGLLGKVGQSAWLNQLGSLSNVAGQMLALSRPQMKPKEFLTEAHKRAKLQAQEALNKGRDSANMLYGMASNIANKSGLQAMQAMQAQAAATGGEGGGVAAAIGSRAKDAAWSNTSMNAAANAAEIGNMIEQQAFGNQVSLSQDTQLLDPGMRKDEAILMGLGQVPGALLEGKRKSVELANLDMYNRYLKEIPDKSKDIVQSNIVNNNSIGNLRKPNQGSIMMNRLGQYLPVVANTNAGNANIGNILRGVMNSSWSNVLKNYKRGY